MKPAQLDKTVSAIMQHVEESKAASAMAHVSTSKPTSAILNQALKIQETAQQLIRKGYAGGVNTRQGRAVIAWTLARYRFAERVPGNLVDCQILLHFAMQALGAIPNAVANGTPEEAQALAAEASAAISSLGTFLQKSTGKTVSDLGLFTNFFPETFH